MEAPLDPTPRRSHPGTRAPLRRRRARADRLAAAVVTGGGVGIIASILGIALFILGEALPLARPAHVEPSRTFQAAAPPELVFIDPHRTAIATVAGDAMLEVRRLADGARLLRRALLTAPGASAAGAVRTSGAEGFAVATTDGRVAVSPLAWKARYTAAGRSVEAELGAPSEIRAGPDGRAPDAFAARLDEDGSRTVVAAFGRRLVAVVLTREENILTGEVSESERRFEVETEAPLSALVLASDGAVIGARGPSLRWWKLGAAGLEARPTAPVGGAPITRLGLLLGERAVVVGRADGALEVWFAIPRPGRAPLLRRIRSFPALSGAIVALAHSRRNRSFLAAASDGALALLHSTSERELWRGKAPLPRVRAIAYAPKGDAALVAGRERIAELAISNPHPEVSLGALFGPVWYEGAPAPAFVWQSSGGSDDFEPKLSLVPLLVGTLKGTFYSLIIAIPLAVLGAMYLSQFMAPRLRRVVKPAIELMAATPSVVLGFLAGLWLAPRLERSFPALLLCFALLPLLTIVAGWAFERLPARLRSRLPAGAETFAFLAVLAAGLELSVLLGPWLEGALFGGDFSTWLLGSTGLHYDQRNAIVVGIAMGFAVIPIIFAISEDAFAHVPPALVSASLALGANRWQTVTRVVLPTASPGIFSAIMIGFGRAVGETMIVLMATGNTPILDWSPFNGFRTLSANLAVEIPEAPQFGTLYRVLFLSALLLFLLTFAVNTAAEVVRHRLRARYGHA